MDQLIVSKNSRYYYEPLTTSNQWRTALSRRDKFSGLTEFLAVAERKSFRAASTELRVTPAAISQAVKALEARVGMPLFLRTTRSVALSEAGEKLLARLRPAAMEIGEAIDEVGALRGTPAGELRLSQLYRIGQIVVAAQIATPHPGSEVLHQEHQPEGHHQAARLEDVQVG